MGLRPAVEPAIGLRPCCGAEAFPAARFPSPARPSLASFPRHAAAVSLGSVAIAVGRPHPVPLCQALCHSQACPVLPPSSRLTHRLCCVSQHRLGGDSETPPPHSTHRHKALPECAGGAPGWAGGGPGGQDGSRRRLWGAAPLRPAVANVPPAWQPLVPEAGRVGTARGAGAGGVGCGAGTVDGGFWWGEGQGAGGGQAVSCERR